ncbi:RDD family protein [Shewanella woodyi]|uniref:RDD domain containing protein n=1 Tax=Shewanella woodyi (strain ATCC 51908 / MS32) TaxID=392500 RepID=B1KJU4_SHEWM|nr:RDD family protein [Shewanella woodyi]ACA87131.1 RDD domain containing protein [Shewanella woodyi ATCC 51908]
MIRENPTVDSKAMVTPFAFEIAPELLYSPLASPLKRGGAMIIDGLLVAVLAEQAGWVFILLVGLTLAIQKKSRQLGKFFKWGLYSLMLVMLLVVAFDNLITTSSSNTPSQEQGDKAESAELSSFQVLGEILDYAPKLVSFSQCSDITCAESELAELLPAVITSSLTYAEKRAVLSGAIEELPLSADEQKALLARVDIALAPFDSDKSIEPLPSLNPDAAETIAPSMPIKERHSPTPSKLEDQLLELDKEEFEEVDEGDKYSLLSWAKGMLNDLGLGFGWAAFYFTVFTAWFDGQTLGKKLLRIRVVQLDGTGLSLWDAFGRYGGYGAGFATGLLGFLQIYWDANRQAIQDKISATVVIDLNRLNTQIVLPERQGD